MKLFLFILPLIGLFFLNFQANDSRFAIKACENKKILKKDAKKLAEYYRQRVVRGESMASIAQLYSEDSGSAQNGGLYKGIVRGKMVPEFDAVAFKLKPNDISEVFESKFGFHFIQLISNNNDVLTLRHVLITRD